MKVTITNERTESPIRMCREHEVYFIEGIGVHKDHASFSLQWAEVTYYLDKLRTIKDLFNNLRRELSI